MMQSVSASEARRIALAAQGFSASRSPGRIDLRHLRQVLDRIGLFQIDSVNILARAHYLPLFSRLGCYPLSLLESAAWGPGKALFEYWAHEASLLPQETFPFLRWRMARADRGEGVWGQIKPFALERRSEAEAIAVRIAAEGPLAASSLEGSKGQGGWWGWSDAKLALEWLFWSGRVTTATRQSNFQRVYDLTERVLPAIVFDQAAPCEEDAHRHLLRLSAQALGVATAGDLRDYFRLSPQDAHPRLAELVEAGELTPVRVEGWSQDAFLHASALAPRRISARALLAPFDPLIWRRARTERLFGFRYRLEIYTPAAKRTHGYYVLPFLLGDRLVARVDLKADRAARQLRVLSAHREAGAKGDIAGPLDEELRLMARWLGLSGYEVWPKGDLADALTAKAEPEACGRLPPISPKAPRSRRL